MIGQNIGNYRVLRLLGQGGMGEVFEAVHEQIRRRAAVKVLNSFYSKNEEMTQRFFNEALAANVIQHPSIVGIFESGRLPDGRAFIVMEYLEGESLRKRIQRTGALPEEEALRLGRQVAAALAASHDKGIIHRDLKSDNVMLVDDPEVQGSKRVKILDFGIAKVAAEYQVNAIKTKDGVVMGTPEYMSPEQWMSSNVVDAKADAYALGVMLYEMLAGQYPFYGENPNQIMVQHLYDDPRPLRDVAPSVSAEAADLVNSMLSKTRAARPTMREVAARLDAILDRQNVMVAPTVAVRKLTMPSKSGAAAVSSPGYRPSGPSDATVMAQDGALLKPESGTSREARTMVTSEDATRMAPADLLEKVGRQNRSDRGIMSKVVVAILLLVALAAVVYFFLGLKSYHASQPGGVPSSLSREVQPQPTARVPSRIGTVPTTELAESATADGGTPLHLDRAVDASKVGTAERQEGLAAQGVKPAAVAPDKALAAALLAMQLGKYAEAISLASSCSARSSIKCAWVFGVSACKIRGSSDARTRVQNINAALRILLEANRNDLIGEIHNACAGSGLSRDANEMYSMPEPLAIRSLPAADVEKTESQSSSGKPIGTTCVDRANQHLSNQEYKQALRLAELCVHGLGESPVKSWSILGQAACNLNDLGKATLAFQKLFAMNAPDSTKTLILHLCESKGITLPVPTDSGNL